MNAPVRTTSMDYTRPYRPRLIAVINAAGRLFRALRRKGARFDTKSLMRKAMMKAGLQDFGDPAFMERMALLTGEMESEARLHPFGAFAARQNIVRFLTNRLKIEDALKRNPEILEVPMEDPVFVVGLQRTGTTMLQRLLASDEDTFRFLASWEAINPAPFTGKKMAGKGDPRVSMAIMAGKALKYMAPDFFAIHPVEPLDPEEDCLLFDFDFWSTVPEATMRVPSFSRWLEGRDHTDGYGYYKKILQYLYWQNPRGRWILKTPQHMEHFEELFRVFPGAKIIQTHRDPAKVVASFCSMVSHAYGVFSDEVDPVEIGAHWSRKAHRMVSRSIEARKGRAGSFFDVHYDDLVADPVAQVGRVYDFIDLPFGKEGAARVRCWAERNPQHRHGRHIYRLEDFGLDRTSMSRDFAEYRKAFGVREEGANG